MIKSVAPFFESLKKKTFPCQFKNNSGKPEEKSKIESTYIEEDVESIKRKIFPCQFKNWTGKPNDNPKQQKSSDKRFHENRKSMIKEDFSCINKDPSSIGFLLSQNNNYIPARNNDTHKKSVNFVEPITEIVEQLIVPIISEQDVDEQVIAEEEIVEQAIAEQDVVETVIAEPVKIGRAHV